MKRQGNLLLVALSVALLVSPALADVNSNHLVQDSVPQDLSPAGPAGKTPRLPAPQLGPPLTSGVGVPLAAPAGGGTAVVAKPAAVNPAPAAPAGVALAPPVAGAPIVAVVAEGPRAPVATPQTVPPVAAAVPPVAGAMPATVQAQATAPMTGAVAAPGPVQVQGEVPAQALASPIVHSYCGYVYPGNSILISGASALRANMDGTIYAHPSFPGRNMFWNQAEDRWCYQDSTSPTGWLFVPQEILIPRPY